jgi:hypothetical protein
MSRLEQQAERFEELLKSNPSDAQVRAWLCGSAKLWCWCGVEAAWMFASADRFLLIA